MKKALLLSAFTITLFVTPIAFAQTTIDLTAVGNYQTRGSARITAEGSRYRVTARVENLPDQIPNNGRYYILWATIQDGRADNLGSITNNNEVSTTVAGTPKQIFVTAEKERFPEFVQGPRLTQSREIAPNELTALATPSPTPVRSPGVGGSGTTPTASPVIGRPNDAPETGLGGSYVFYTIAAALIVFGSFGALMTLKNTAQSKR